MKTKSFYDECHDWMRERIRWRGYYERGLSTGLSTRYAETKEALQKAEKEVARLKESIANLFVELDEQYPATAPEAKKQLSAELWCWQEDYPELHREDRKEVLEIVERLKRGETIEFGALDTFVREALPDGLWDAITAEPKR